jgi:hypothetical protein
MAVYHPPMPATASQMEQLIAEIKKAAAEKDKITNELNVQTPSQYFQNQFGAENKGDLLNVFVERFNTTFNVYWKKIDEAAEYTVEIYKYISNEWYKLSDIFVSRADAYLSITNLVGVGYVFRVIARDRNGIEIAKSEGTIIGFKTAE